MDNLASEGLGVNSCPYDRDDIIRNLDFIRDLIYMSNPPQDVIRAFNTCAAEIENATDYLMARLRHAEYERFSNG